MSSDPQYSAALADLLSVVTAIGGYLTPEQQDAVRRARAVLAAGGAEPAAERSAVTPGAETAVLTPLEWMPVPWMPAPGEDCAVQLAETGDRWWLVTAAEAKSPDSWLVPREVGMPPLGTVTAMRPLTAGVERSTR